MNPDSGIRKTISGASDFSEAPYFCVFCETGHEVTVAKAVEYIGYGGGGVPATGPAGVPTRRVDG